MGFVSDFFRSILGIEKPGRPPPPPPPIVIPPLPTADLAAEREAEFASERLRARKKIDEQRKRGIRPGTRPTILGGSVGRDEAVFSKTLLGE